MSINKKQKSLTTSTRQKYNEAIAVASENMADGLEPRSALKQAGADMGIPYGEEMGKFIQYAEHVIYKSPYVIYKKAKVHKHDVILLDLAHFTLRCYRYASNTGQPKLASDLLARWQEWNGKDYMEKACGEWSEKRIELYLRLIATSESSPSERKHLAAGLSCEVRQYVRMVVDCPSGFYSKDVYKMVDDILDPV